MKFKYNILLLTFLILTFLTICSYPQQMKSKIKDKMMKEQITKAVCVIQPTKGHKAHGLIIFSKVENGIKVVANIHGLKSGKHGFHIHEYGDCSAVDGTSAGGHFNPENINHGGPMDNVRHVGDLGNIIADVYGNVEFEFIDSSLNFGGQHSIIGRAVIIHEGEDDLHTQPTGAAGPRAGCGVIGIAKQ